jgi:GH15 family glucan-1,4-alpha-glucosidase
MPDLQDYPPIAEHGLIGDLRTAAVVTTGGSIDWFCCPRFDSPSVLGSLLDAARGGHFRVRPTATDSVVRQLYLPDTAVLVTRFMTEGGVGELYDFMPPAGSQATDTGIPAPRTAAPERSIDLEPQARTAAAAAGPEPDGG